MKKYLVLFSLIICVLYVQAQQNVGIGTTSPSASSILDVTSTSKGFLLPRMTGIQRIAIVSPATGLMVYQTNNDLITGPIGFYIYDGSIWKRFARTDELGWTVSGSSVFTLASGGVGIGISTPNASAVLDLTSTTKGLLIPRMNSTQRTAIVSPPQGMMVFQNTGTSTLGFWYHDGTTWQRFAKASELVGSASWTIAGDNQYSNVDGNVGIGVTSGINEKLFLNGDMFINAPGGPLGNQLNSAELKLRGTSLGTGAVAFLKPDSTTAASIYYSSFSNNLNIAHSSGGRTMRFYNSGKIQIGSGNGAWPDTAVSVLHIKDGDFANYTTHHGFFMLGSKTSTNLVFSNYEILARDNGAAAPLYLQQDGGAVRIGNTGSTADTRLHITDGGESSLTTHGYVVLGPVTAGNLVMDPNEIQARSNGAATTLRLQQDGGSLVVQGGALTVASNGYVGIGTLAPSRKLHVEGNGYFKSDDQALAIDGVSPQITFYNSSVYKSFIQQTSTKLHIGVNGGKLQLDASQIAIGSVQSTADSYKLAVTGKIICEELKVELVADWPDYVFTDDYHLTPLHELKSFINTNQHLPNIPKASEIRKEGFEVGEMNRKLLEKVEELTLYIIQQQEQIDALKKSVGIE